MTTVKFGDRVTITASPALVLSLSELIEEWLDDALGKIELDTERESLCMAQRIVGVLARMEHKNKELNWHDDHLYDDGDNCVGWVSLVEGFDGGWRSHVVGKEVLLHPTKQDAKRRIEEHLKSMEATP